MKILKVTIEYDEATYIAEGPNAQSWREWMLGAEKRTREAGLPVWDNWSRIDGGPTGAVASEEPNPPA